MSAFLYGVCLQWKTDLRNNSAFIAFYAVPIVFLFIFGGVFTSVMPDGQKTLLPMMTTFAVSMAALIGVPQGICESYRAEIRSTYRVGGLPEWQSLVQAEIAAFLHLIVLALIIAMLSTLVFDAAPPRDMAAFLTGLLLLILSTLSLSGAVGLTAKNQAAVSAIATAVFLPSILLSGIMFPSAMLPEVLQYIGTVFPATWGFRLMSASEVLWDDVWPMLTIAAAGGLAVTALLRWKRHIAA